MQAFLSRGLDLSLSETIIKPHERSIAVPVRGGLIIPSGVNLNRSPWPVINERWRSLASSEQRKVLPISKLPANILAEIVIRLPVKTKDKVTLKQFLTLRSDSPTWLRQIEFSLDAMLDSERIIEAALSGDRGEPDKAHAFRVLNQLLFEARFQKFENRALQQRVDSAFHLHIGLVESCPESLREAFAAAAYEYRRLTAIRLLNAGRHNDVILEPSSPVSFVRDMGVKSLIYLPNDTHVEIRELTDTPENVYQEFIHLVAIGPKQARAEVEQQLREIFANNTQLGHRILKHNASAMLPFLESLPKDFPLLKIFDELLKQGLNLDSFADFFKMAASHDEWALQLIDRLMNVEHELQPQGWGRIVRLLVSNVHVRRRVRSKIEADYRAFPLSEYAPFITELDLDFDPRVEILAQSHNERERFEALKALESYLAIDHSSDDPIFHRLNQALIHLYDQPNPDQVFEREWLLAYRLHNELHSNRYQFVNLKNVNAVSAALSNVWNADEAVSSAALLVLRHKRKVTQLQETTWEQYIFPYQSIDNFHLFFDEIYHNELPARERNQIRKVIFKVVALGAAPPPAFLDAITTHEHASDFWPLLCEAQLLSPAR